MIKVKTIVSKLRAGMSVVEIAADEGVREGTLRNFMSVNNIRVRDIQTQLIREELENGSLQTGIKA